MNNKTQNQNTNQQTTKASDDDLELLMELASQNLKYIFSDEELDQMEKEYRKSN